MEDLKNKNNLFTSNDITLKCPIDMKWEDMKEVKDGRFCYGCYEKLYYVGGYTKGEVKSLQRKYGSNICVGIRTLAKNNITNYPIVVGVALI